MEGLLQKGMASAMGGGQPPQTMASPEVVSGAQAGVGEDAPNVTGDEQAEYERAMAAVMAMIHKDPGGQKSVVDSFDPANPVGSVANAAFTVIITVDEKIDLAEGVIMPLAEEVVPLIVEIGVTSKKIQITPKQIEQALGTTAEMLLDHYGIDEQDYQIANQGQDEQANMRTYQETLKGDTGEANVQQ